MPHKTVRAEPPSSLDREVAKRKCCNGLAALNGSMGAQKGAGMQSKGRERCAGQPACLQALPCSNT